MNPVSIWYRYSNRFRIGIVFFGICATDFGQRTLLIPRLEPKLTAYPAAIDLDGPYSSAQLVISGTPVGGSERDVTAEAVVRSDDDAVSTEPTGFVRPRRDGKTALTIEALGASIRIPVNVRRMNESTVSFRRDI